MKRIGSFDLRAYAALAAAMVAACGGASADVAPAYEFLEYADRPTTSSPVIDTGVVPTATMEFRFKYAMLTTSTWSNFFTSYKDEDTESTRIITNSGSATSVYAYFLSKAGGGSTAMNNVTKALTDVREGYINISKAKVNSVEVNLNRVSTTAKCENPVKLFGYNTRCWYFSSLDNGVYTRHYLPCRRTSDGVVGLWDVVGKSFVEPTGGALTAGPVDAGYRVDANGVCQFGVVATAKGKGTVKVNDGEPGATASAWCNVLEPGATALSTLTATVTPVAEEGYRFYYWEGDLDGVTVDANGVATVPCGSARSLVCHFVDADHFGVRRAWSGGGDGKSWSDPANWDPAGVPGEQDDVSIAAGKSLVLSESTPALDSLTVAGTLTFTNWMTRLNAGSVVVQNGGVVTCVGPFKDGAMSNRVWIACNELDVKVGGSIHADKRGYAALNGPGVKNFTASQRKTYRGGTYGGTASGSGVTYGSLTEPTDPGTGGCGQQNTPSTTGENAGGGAIRIDATGEVKVDGRISADGSSVVTWKASAASGGSVYISCLAIKGSGRVSASSTDYSRTATQNNQFQGGSGGRIAVHYSPSAQSAYDASGCTVGFYAAGSVGYYGVDYSSLTDEGYMANAGSRPQSVASVGTLYFPDNRFLTNAAYASAGRRFAGEWHSADASDSIVVPGPFDLDGLLDLGKSFRNLTIGDSITVSALHGHGAGLVLSNVSAVVAGDCTLTGGRIDLRGGSFTVGGNLLMSSTDETSSISGSQLCVRAMPTNGLDKVWGAQVEIFRKWTMEHKSAVYAYAHGVNGSVPYFHVKSFELGPDAVLDGCMKGYNKENGPGYSYQGVSHGGRGGAATNSMSGLKQPYGSREHPVTPGSGGGGTNAKPGGGALIVHAEGSMKVNGRINVQGQCENVGWASGSSAGSVYLRARKFESEGGSISAKGGRGDNSAGKQGSGGGGRVAIWAQEFGTTNIEINVLGGTRCVATQVEAEPGTIYWGVIPPIPGFMIFVQ